MQVLGRIKLNEKYYPQTGVVLTKIIQKYKYIYIYIYVYFHHGRAITGVDIDNSIHPHKDRR